MQSVNESLAKHRDQFPALKNKTYLNFGGQGVMPQTSIDALVASYQFVQERGPFNAAIFQWMVSEQDSTREALASELHGRPSGFTLTQNVTEGCNIVVWGVDWNPGDHLLTTDCEHVGVIHSLMQLQKRRNVNLEFCKLSEAKSETEMIDVIERSLTDRTRLVLISHVLWNTGRRLPVKEIAELCRKRNVILLVDGAQSAGSIECRLDTGDSGDFFAMTGHKWMGGPEGIGSVYVAPGALELIQPTFVGWRGSTMDYKTGQPTGFNPNASRFEVGTAPLPLLSGLRNSLKVHNAFASSEVRGRLILEGANKLISKLSRIDRVTCLLTEAQSGLVCFQIEGVSHKDVVAKLDSQQIFVRTIPVPDCIRASVHYFTSEVDQDNLVAALEEIVKAS